MLIMRKNRGERVINKGINGNERIDDEKGDMAIMENMNAIDRQIDKRIDEKRQTR